MSEPIKVQKPKAAAPARIPALGMPKTVKIYLEENEHIPPNGQFVGINGKGWLIPPGVPVEVPEGVCEILDNATELVPIKNPATQQVVGWKTKQRYPYRRLP